MRTPGRFLVAVAAALALAALATVAALVWQQVRPRLPGVAGAVPTLDLAVAGVVTAAGDSAAVAVTDLLPAAACQNTPLAKGSRYTRTANLYTDPAGEDALIARIAAALAASEAPRRGTQPGGGAAPLDADLGAGIHLHVARIGEGWVAATAMTDCRAGHPGSGATSLPADATTAVDGLFTRLGTAASWHTDAVGCATGRIVTVNALSRPAAADNLSGRLAAAVPAGARTFTSGSNRLAWRTATTSVIVAASDDGAHITVQRTTTC